MYSSNDLSAVVFPKKRR